MPTGLQKLLTLNALADEVRALQRRGKTVAHCHGCFDILHAGHLRHFEQARAMADALVVTVTPDRFVNKGPDRPLFPQHIRAELVGGLGAVDWVAVNEWATAVRTIELLRPDLFVKGEEYELRTTETNPYFIAESEAIATTGGRIAFTRGFTLSSTAAFHRLVDGRV